MKLLAIVLLCAGAACGQTIQVTGGTSNLLNASGGSATLYTPSSTSTVSVGLFGGHLVAGADTMFGWDGWNVRLGDSPLFLSTVGAGTAVQLRGVTVRRGKLTLFAGATGRAFSVPFFQAAQVANLGIGGQYASVGKWLDTSTVAAIDGRLHTVLEGLNLHAKEYSLGMSGGVLEDRPFFTSTGTARWRHAAATVSHQLGTTSLAGFVTDGPFDANASAYQNGHTVGATAGAGVHFAWASIRGQEFVSRNHVFTGTVAEAVGQRFRLSQYVGLSGGKPTVSGGLTYSSNRLTADVSQSAYFTPTGFVQAFTVTVTLQVRDSSVSSSAYVPPGGRVHWTTYAGTFVQTGMPVGPHTVSKSIGGVVVEGIVLDDRGRGVDGAALQINKMLVYTDSEGRFEARLRKPRPVTVSVLVEEFAAPGIWQVVDAPVAATPGTSVTIRVRRSQ